MDDQGLAQSAILLLSLGEEDAAEVFKHLSPKEVHKIGELMARTKDLTRDKVDTVLKNFMEAAGLQTSVGGDGDAYIRSVLTKALGEDKANLLLDRILQGQDVTGIEGLKWVDAASVAELVKNEHPQVIATILVHLERDHASEVLNFLPERLRNDVVMRIATIDGIQPNALQELNDVLTKVLSGSDKLKKAPLGGVRTAAEILNFIGTARGTAVLEAIREHDADLAQKILDEMFTFDNLMDVDDRGLQMLLREVQSESLIVALKGAKEDLREKIFSNMSQRAGDMLREDLELKGPVKLREVEAEQKEILKIARRLAEEGQLNLGKKGEDQYV
jgi:flagellar motor switch protein FliG